MRINVANPSDKHWSGRRFLFAFGAFGAGSTYVLAYGGLEDALEAAAGWLADNAPGHLMEAWGPEHTALVEEACTDAGLVYPPANDLTDAEADAYAQAQQDAEADLTYTEAGYLTSYEWFIVAEDPTREDLISVAHGGR